MLPESWEGDPLREALFGAGVFAVAALLGLIAEPVIARAARQFSRNTKTQLDDFMVEALGRPIQFLLIIQGTRFALTWTTYLDRWQSAVDKTWAVLMVAVGSITLFRAFRGALHWYSAEVATRTVSSLDDRMLPLVNRVMATLILGSGTLTIASLLGMEIQPILAGLGLGGLAVALALQPTLTNLIASAWMATDGTAAAGDFIEVQGGPTGTVLDVGWRTTRIMTLLGNVVMVPNSVLANSVLTNYQAVTPEMNIVVPVTVDYNMDLEHVERVCLEVAKSVQDEQPATVVVKSFKPLVRFREFGDSHIGAVVVLRAADRAGVALVNHEMIKRLHKRFGQEGIEFAYPVRKLVYAPPNGAAPAPAHARVHAGPEDPRADDEDPAATEAEHA